MRRIAFVIALTSCHADRAPPCEAVANQFFLLATAELDTATLDPTTGRAAAAQLPALRDALRLACHNGRWADDVRSCMINARDHVAMQRCEQKLSDDQRAAFAGNL